MKMWRGGLVAMVAAAVAVVGASCGGAGTTSSGTVDMVGTVDSSGAGEANGTVVRVVDGDTVDIDFGASTERVRLIGIDTPETKKPNTPVQCFGPEASEFTASLLAPGTAVVVTRDAEARDDYGRLLGYLHRASDGLFVNLALVAGGYAQPLTIAPNTTYATQFVSAALEAEAQGTGLWGACSG